MRTVRQFGLVILIALTGITATSCSGSSNDSASMATAGAATEGSVAGARGVVSGDTSAPAGSGSGDPAVATPAQDDRKLIVKVTVGVEVDDVAASVNKVIALSSTHGGELSASSVDLSDPQTAGGDLVFRIPPEETDAFIAGLDPGVGRRTSLQTGKEDVTLKVTDLQTRIDNAGASLDRVRALLAQAKNIGEVISLESELTQRENTLEELLAQKTYLDSQVAMSTVTVHLSASGVEPTAAAKKDTGVGHAFRSGWNGFVTFLGSIVKFIGYTLPFLVLFGVAALVALPITRRVRRNRSAAPLHPPAPGEDQRMSAPGS
jgi:hypothetical protein